jgi:hypothetical protein
MNRIGLGGLFAIAVTSACTGTGTTITVPLPATAIVVDPKEFLGNVPCFPRFGDSSDAPGGAMRLYVATLVSVRAGGALDAGGVALPSSPPTRCSDRVSFQRVVNGTAYVAEIDGYDVDQIRPLGANGLAGSRVMVDEQDRFVPPRWQTSCGKQMTSTLGPADAAPDGAEDAAPVTGSRDAARASFDTGVEPYGRCTGRALEAGEAPDLEGPVCARANIVIPMRGCAPLVEVNPPNSKTTALVVDLADALQVSTAPDGRQCLACGDGAGQVSRFRVELDGSSEPPRTGACAESMEFELPPGKLATFTVTAYGSGASPGADACKTGDGGSGAGKDAESSGGSTHDAAACESERQTDKGNAGVWCTRCFGQPLPGTTLRATCDPLAATQRRPY